MLTWDLNFMNEQLLICLVVAITMLHQALLQISIAVRYLPARK